jgi:uncharacterized membrane protein YdjX (TVP38/TMEM64 family)
MLALTVVAFGILTSLGMPVTVAIGLAALTLGTWLGFGVAALGTALSASIGYGLGKVLGSELVERIPNRQMGAITWALRKGGIISIVTLRVVPVAPFALVNMVAGAAAVRRRDYALGTILGMAPGMLGLSVLIDRVVAALRNPTPGTFTALFLMLLVIASLLASLVTWARRRSRSDEGTRAGLAPAGPGLLETRAQPTGEMPWPRPLQPSKSGSRAKTSSSPPSKS